MDRRDGKHSYGDIVYAFCRMGISSEGRWGSYQGIAVEGKGVVGSGGGICCGKSSIYAKRIMTIATLKMLSLRPEFAIPFITGSSPSSRFLLRAIMAVIRPAIPRIKPPKNKNAIKELRAKLEASSGGTPKIVTHNQIANAKRINPTDSIPRIRLIFASRSIPWAD